MNKYDPKRPEVRLYAALNNYDPSDIRETAYLLLFFDGHDLSALGAEHERIVAERLAPIVAERDAAIAERNQLRNALRYFLDDPRFLVSVGGNPIVVEAMLKEAIEVLDKTK